MVGGKWMQDFSYLHELEGFRVVMDFRQRARGYGWKDWKQSTPRDHSVCSFFHLPNLGVLDKFGPVATESCLSDPFSWDQLYSEENPSDARFQRGFAWRMDWATSRKGGTGKHPPIHRLGKRTTCFQLWCLKVEYYLIHGHWKLRSSADLINYLKSQRSSPEDLSVTSFFFPANPPEPSSLATTFKGRP